MINIMKIQLKLAMLALLSILVLQPSALVAQGSLTPPGAPAPTMKSLDQVEARTAITNTSSLVVISQPGSYYLTGNLTVSTGDGIDINTNDVTLDLNGFTIRSTAASATGTGILLGNGWNDITIGNGHIRGNGTNNASGVFGGGGFTYGIKTSGAVPENVLVSRISVSGCQFDGISLSGQNSTVVETCTVQMVGGYGIAASTVKSCWAYDCGNTAINGDQVLDCHGQSYGGDGISGIVVRSCYGSSAGLASVGITRGIFGDTVQDSYGTNSNGTGISANSAANCQGTGSFDGVFAEVAQNCYGKSGGSGDGMFVNYTASGCFGFSISGTGLYANTANSCTGTSPSGTPLSVTHNLNSYSF